VREGVQIEAVAERDGQITRVAALLAAEPMVRSSESDSVRKPCGLMLPPSVALSRSNAALADSSDTCCSRIRWMSVAYEGSRAHSGGVPNRSTDAARAGSAFTSSVTARTSDRRVSGRIMGRASSRIIPRAEAGNPDPI
jgi:hypothetical protein